MPPPRCTFLLALALLEGCAHTVVLDSEPPGAQVEVNGSYLGQAPVTLLDRSGMKRTYSVTLRRPGSQERTVVLTQQVKLPTFCCPLLWLWSWELPEDRYTFRLPPDDGAPPRPPPGFLPPDPSRAPVGE